MQWLTLHEIGAIMSQRANYPSGGSGQALTIPGRYLVQGVGPTSLSIRKGYPDRARISGQARALIVDTN